MRWKECIRLIHSDLRRIKGNGGAIFAYLWKESFRLSFWFRIGTTLQSKSKIYFPIYLVVKVIYKHLQHKTGIQLPIGTKVGEGLYFFHYGCIVIAQTAVIGKNASIHQGVTIGRVFNGKKAGVPNIGNNVVIFAGAKVLGNVKVGDNAVIGANTVVTSDIPENAVAVGCPAKVISSDSSHCFNEYWGEYFAHPYEKE